MNPPRPRPKPGRRQPRLLDGGAEGKLNMMSAATAGSSRHPPLPDLPPLPVGEHGRPGRRRHRARSIRCTINYQAWVPGLEVPLRDRADPRSTTCRGSC